MTDYIEDPGWELYRSFLAVLQEGSLSAAARALGVTQPTIGRHIDALEAALGFALFTRSQHGFKPTEAALALGPHAENLALNAAALLRVASAHGGDGSAVRGTVRISASEVVGAEVLPPILTALRVAHPQLVIELVLSNRIDDLLLRQADIAIRMLRRRKRRWSRAAPATSHWDCMPIVAICNSIRRTSGKWMIEKRLPSLRVPCRRSLAY